MNSKTTNTFTKMTYIFFYFPFLAHKSQIGVGLFGPFASERIRRSELRN